MKKSLLYLGIIFAFSLAIVSCKKEDVAPPDDVVTINPLDTLVKFTLYSNRVPFIWKRMVESNWVQDTIKTNHAVRYEPFNTDHYGYGYWVTHNLNGQTTDSLHIKAEYKGKMTQMSSLKYQSAAYVLIDNVKP